jgi:hypothetical protein
MASNGSSSLATTARSFSRGLLAAEGILEAPLRICPVFLSALEVRVASFGQPQNLAAPVGRIGPNRGQGIALKGPDIPAKRRVAISEPADWLRSRPIGRADHRHGRDVYRGRPPRSRLVGRLSGSMAILRSARKIGAYAHFS